MRSAFKMPGFSGFGNSPLTQKVDLTKKANPKTKAIKSKDYKIDEKEEQIIENMSNQETRSEIIRHEKYLADLAKKKKSVKPKSGDMKKYSDLEKYDDDK